MALRFDQIELSGSSNGEKPVIQANGHYAQISTAYGYVNIGPGNSSYSHFNTDRGKYYFNKRIMVDEGIISSFDEDLHLKVNNDANTVMTLSKTSPYNVGIGTTNPGAMLQVGNGASYNTLFHTFDQYNEVKFHGVSNQSASGVWQFINDGTWNQTRFYVQDANNVASRLTFRFTGNNGANEILAGTSTGNVGIGTTDPQEKLDVNGNIYLSGLLPQSSIIWKNPVLGTGPSITTNSAAYLIFETPGAGQAMTIENAGDVGIGATNPVAKLHIDAPTGDFLKITESGANRLLLDSNGELILTPPPNWGAHFKVGQNVGAYQSAIQVGEGRTANGYSYIDFIGDTTYTDYGLRLIRNNTGANTTSQLVHRGTGNLELVSTDSGDIVLNPNSGNVGIGNTNPGYKLEVNGTAAASSFTSNNFSAGVQGFAIESGDSAVTTYRFDANRFRFYSGNYGEIVSIKENGNVGIGTTSPAEKLAVAGNVTVSGTGSFGSTVDAASPNINNWIFKATNSDFASESGFYDANNHVDMILRNSSDAITTHIRSNGFSYLNGGNVGIGTTSPSEKLQVNGNIKFGGTTDKLLSSNGYAHLAFDSIGGFVLGDENYNYSGTFIKSDSDNYNIEFESDTLTMMRMYYGAIEIPSYIRHLGDTNTRFGFPSSDRFLIQTAGSTRFFIDPSGNIGIGTTTPSYQLQLSQNSAAKPTSSSWTVVSDERVKTNIRPYESGLEELLQVEPKVFDYNGKAGFDAEVKDNIGVIAQEIKDVMPETVKTYKAKLNEGDKEDTELYNFDSHALTFALINAVKELNGKIEELQTQIQTLKQNG